MSVRNSKKLLLLSTTVAIIAGAVWISGPRKAEQITTTAQQSALGEQPDLSNSIPTAVDSHDHGNEHVCGNCEHSQDPVVPVQQVISVAENDAIFKEIAAATDSMRMSREDFEVFHGTQIGQSINFTIGSRTFEGELFMVRESEFARKYGLDFGTGKMTVSHEGNGSFRADVFFNGDSRVIHIADGIPRDDGHNLVVQEVAVSDRICAPEGTVYPLSNPQVVNMGALSDSSPTPAPFVGEASAPLLNSDPSGPYVLYLDFDGEVVSNTDWNSASLPKINADPHPQVNNDEWVTAVWGRVAEDFAPFDIAVTTDRAYYEAADPDKRLMVVCTPTDDASPGSGGVAFIGSFREDSPVAWCFNLSEYGAANTISHEAGHTFGLWHHGPGKPGAPYDAYYGGHNDDYAPGWAPIMGAEFNDPGAAFLDEVVQWSKGEFPNAGVYDNDFLIQFITEQDDIAIIGSTGSIFANGFGFKADLVADTFDSLFPQPGVITTLTPGVVGASGTIETSNDVDVFSFYVLDGDVDLTVFPLDVDSQQGETGSDTQGANLAVDIELLDANGAVIASGVPVGETLLASRVQATLTEGQYFLAVSGGGRGADGEVGFTDYASVGQYTIGGIGKTPSLFVGGGNKEEPIVASSTTLLESNNTDFGFKQINTGALNHTFVLRNTQSEAITNLSLALDIDSEFSIQSAVPSTLDAGQPAYFTITYEPTQIGVDNDIVSISYDVDGAQEIFLFSIGAVASNFQNDDNYEQNDSPSSPRDLGELEGVRLSEHLGKALMMDYVDWYTFTADSNDEVIRIFTSHDSSAGPIQFTLRHISGVDLIVKPGSEDEQIIDYLIPPGMTDRRFLIKAQPAAGGQYLDNSYDLAWYAFASVANGDDLYEQNDSQASAYDLTGAPSDRLSGILGQGISNDEDWYKITIPADPFVRMLYVAAEFEHSEGNIDIEVIPASLSPFSSNDLVSATQNNREVVTYHELVLTEDFAENFTPEGNTVIMGVEPGTYYIRVYGDFAGNSYDLIVDPAREDRYEVIDAEGTENDSITAAFDLGTSIMDTWLSNIDGVGTCAVYGVNATAENFVNGSDPDCYKFTVDARGQTQQLAIDFESFDGGTVIFSVYNEDLVRIGQSTETDGDVTTIFGSGVINVPLQDTSTYYLVVEPFTEVDYISGYDFRVSLTGVSPVDVSERPDDNYEENDSYLDPYNLIENEGDWLTSVDGYGVLYDADRYRIRIPTGASRIEVLAAFDSSLGDIEMKLTDDDGLFSYPSTTVTNGRSFVFDDPQPGIFQVVLYSENPVGNTYNLFWDVTFDEDNYEENDSIDSPFDLSTNELQPISKLDGMGVQNDEDWYKITVGADQELLRVFARFDHADGDIDMELYYAGSLLLRRAISSSDNEEIEYLNPVAGDYFIRIYSAELDDENNHVETGNEYDLVWATLDEDEVELVNSAEDAYEDNDVATSAYTLLSNTSRLSLIDGSATQADDDWYELFVPEDNLGLYVECFFDHVDGDIDFEIYDPLGTPIVRRESETDNELFDFNGVIPEGTYQIRVYGPGLGSEYDLYCIVRTIDAFEENDVKDEAYDISQSEGDLLSSLGIATQGDDDWYRFSTAESNEVVAVNLTYSHEYGDINLELYDSGGSLLADSVTVEDFEYIQQQLGGSGDYFLRVYGDNLNNSYDLFWNAELEDAFEENDEFVDAYDISGDEGANLDGVVFDDDWFLISAPAGAVSIEVSLTFSHAGGDTDIDVFDADMNLIASEISVTDDELVTFQVNPFGGDYYVLVYGYDGNLGNPYTMTWTSSTLDLYENNETLATATDLSGSEGILISEFAGFATSSDEDWYQINPVAGGLAVYCLFNDAEGNIDIELYDGDGYFVERSISETDDELIQTVVAGGTYYIRVFGDLAGNPYDLIWNQYAGDDGYEENDVFADAADLTGDIFLTIPNLVQADDDWFQVEVFSDQDVVTVECDFDPIGGSIEVELYDASESLDGTAIDYEDGKQLILSGLTAGDYFIRVHGSNAANSYSLRWASSSDDAYEENDDQASAYDITGLEGAQLSSDSGDGVQLDVDWYQVTLSEDDSTIDVSLSYNMAEGLLQINLCAADGTDLGEASSTGNDQLVVSGLAAGDYFLKVTGPSLGTEYDLVWYGFVDDSYEDNDSLLEAYDTTGQPETQLSLIDGLGVRGDDDYYMVESVFDSVRLDVDCAFTHADGDIALAVYASDGTELGSVDSGDDNETLSVAISPEVSTYYIAVTGAANSGATYDLSWSFSTIDGYEDNDDDTEATDITSGQDSLLSEVDGFASQGDDDWYLVTLPVGAQVLTVEATFTHANGDINLEVVDAGLSSLGTATSADDNESLTVDVDPLGGDYYIVVTGDNLGNSYDLTWSLLLDDNYEENDVELDAKDLTGNLGALLSTIDGVGYQYDKDYYSVDLPVNAALLTVELSHNNADGDIDITVFDPSFGVIGDDFGSDDTKTLTVTADPAGGVHRILVFGDDMGNSYDLVWSAIIEDDYEENDSDGAAYDLSAQADTRLSEIATLGTQLDEDWYQITTPADVISVEVLLDSFLDEEGDLNLQVLDSSLVEVALSATENDEESVTFNVDPAGETFFIRVYGEDTGNTYDLVWSPITTDAYEPNDFVEEAYDLFDFENVWLSDLEGFATQEEDDWYAIVVSDGSPSLTIECQFVHADGDIDIELYRFEAKPAEELDDPDADERKPVFVDRATTGDDDETLVLLTPEAGIYFIRVYYGNGGNGYNLRWNDTIDDASGDSVYVDDYSNGTWNYIPRGARRAALLDTPYANADGDEFDNWAEYALALDASEADYAVIGQSQVTIDGKPYYQFEFLRTKEAVARGYVFDVEESANLSFDGSQAVFVGTESISSEVERVFYRCSDPISDAPMCFFRLTVEEPAPKN